MNTRRPTSLRRNWLGRSSRVLLLPFALAFSWISPLYAAPGDLDPTFGTGGIVTTTILGASARAYDAVLQPDGKIVACGLTPDGFALARFNPDGTLDSTFGAEGQVRTAIYLPYPWAFATGIVQWPDGRLYVWGPSASASYRPDGSVEHAGPFGPDYRLVTTVLKPDGGRVSLYAEMYASLAWRLRLNLDAFHGDWLKEAGESTLLLQPDGKVALTVLRGVFGLARFGPDGALDTSFAGGGGVVVAKALETSDAMALVAEPDGKLVVAGQAGSNPSQFALARFSADGINDPTFGTNGIVLTNVGVDAVLHDVVAEPDGRLVAGGEEVTRGQGVPRSANFLLARYNADGSLDTQFGNGGTLRTDLGGGSGIRQLLLQPDGKLVAVGAVTLADGTSRFALARYELGGHRPDGGEGACYSNASCLRQLVAALPPPGAALHKRARRVAFRLSRLSASAGASLETAAAQHGGKQRRMYDRARRVLRTLLALARRADRRHALGVPLEPIQETVARLQSLLGSWSDATGS